MPGVTSTGFESLSASEIRAQLDAALKDGPLGESAGSEPDGSIPLASKAGQLVTLITDPVSALWELGQLLYAAWDPGSAEGAALDHILAITGTERLGPVKSTVTVTATGTPTTVLLVGRVVRVEVAGTRFASLEEQTITLLADWLLSTPYVVGDRRTNAARCYECITAGTSAGSGGPTTTAADITDGTAHWTYLGEGTGAVDVPFEAETAGPLRALAGTLTDIATPVGGWSTATNLEDDNTGRLVETDAAARVRREAELAGEATGTADAIRARVLKVGEGTSTPVVAVTVFQNQTLVTDGNGLPGKSVEVLVDRDTADPDQEIAEAIFGSVVAGIETYGGETATVTDSAGNPQTVKYSRPTEVEIYITVAITYDPLLYPAADITAEGALVKAALALYGQSYPTGRDVTSALLKGAAAFGPTESGGSPVPGIINIPTLYIGTAPAPVSEATIAIALRQKAVFDTARIVVTLTPGTP